MYEKLRQKEFALLEAEKRKVGEEGGEERRGEDEDDEDEDEDEGEADVQGRRRSGSRCRERSSC